MNLYKYLSKPILPEAVSGTVLVRHGAKFTLCHWKELGELDVGGTGTGWAVLGCP